MTQPIGFFKSPTTGNAVTWDIANAHIDTGVPFDAYKLPVTQGFLSTDEADNAKSSRGTPSEYNKWSDMPADTYENYLLKMIAAMNDPLSRWLLGGAAPMTKAQWEEHQARIAEDAKRGVTFGAA